jgi:Tol biopolymer transport system component
MKNKRLTILFGGLILAVIFNISAFAQNFGSWSAPVNLETIPGTSPLLNTPFNDGCPYQSPDGLSLFIASNRPGGLGGLDIWVAHRESQNAPFGEPQNLGAPVNSAADDFCPTPVRGHGLYFVSARAGGCGGVDIYFSRFGNGDWTVPNNLGCHLNSPAGEASPSYFEDENGNSFLYFSSNRAGGAFPDGVTPDSDIYFSFNFGPANVVPNLNTPFEDSRPNVRKDGREIVFDSNRPGTLGATDILTAYRESIYQDWSPPVFFGAPINSPAAESRASLSWDGLTMVFGSMRPGSEGSNDVYVTTREKLRGNER